MKRLENISSNVDFGPKRVKFGPKRAGPGFFQAVKLNFLKEDHKPSFYTKNQQNSIKSLEDISSNVDFGPKRGKFGPKRAGPGFFPDGKAQFSERRLQA